MNGTKFNIENKFTFKPFIMIILLHFKQIYIKITWGSLIKKKRMYILANDLIVQ